MGKPTLIVRLVIIFAAACVALVLLARRMPYMDTPYDATKSQVISLEMKIRAFHLDTHALPRTLKDLVAQNGIENWRGPYAKEREIFDAWGHPVGYEAIDTTGPRFRLF